MKNIAAVTLVAGVLGSTSGTQAGPGYDDYYYGGGYYGGYYAPYPPGPPLPPVPVRQAPAPASSQYYSSPVYGGEFIPPPPPQSCGQYHYWAGDHCADARYAPPYVGPKW